MKAGNLEIVEQVSVIDLAEKGKVIGKSPDGRVFLISNALPGDVVDVQILRRKKGLFEAVSIRERESSSARTQAACIHFGHCGGCSWQHLDYQSQIHYKEKHVRDALERIGKVSVEEYEPIRGAGRIYQYRNKLEFSFSNRRWVPKEEMDLPRETEPGALGFHAPGIFEKVIDIRECHLQPEPSNQIRNQLRLLACQQGLTFYDSREHQGDLRSLMVRITTWGEVMVLVSFGNGDMKKIRPFLEAAVSQCKGVHSWYYCVNLKRNDFLYDQEMILWSGAPRIRERLLNLEYSIGPKSFFQTNTSQAEVLYRVVRELCELRGVETVYDLYTGIGSIALSLASQCRSVVGIEEIPEAVEDARQNAVHNGIRNAEFYAGDVRLVLDEELIRKHGKADVLVTDPPRSGMHPKVVSFLASSGIPRIVYVSCNPSTQARDLAVLAENYRIVKVVPVDMFPHTDHMESVSLLILKQSIQSS